MRGDHHSMRLLVKQHNMPETSLTKESAGNAPCVPHNKLEKLDKSNGKCHWIKLNDLDDMVDMVVVGVKRGDTMPSGLKCLIEWVFLIQKIYFYFKLYSIFTINHFSCIKLYMHYNGLYVVQWCKWCWSYVWHLWKRPMHHHIFVSGQYWLIQYWHHILYWALNPKNVELGDEWRTHFQQEKKTPLLKSLSYRHQQKQKKPH
jgi:hypothetical protein